VKYFKWNISDSHLYKQHIHSLTNIYLCYCHDLRRIRSTQDFDTARYSKSTHQFQARLLQLPKLSPICIPNKPTASNSKFTRQSWHKESTVLPWFCHISQVLQSLHWRKIEQRIAYAIISQTLPSNIIYPRI